MRWELGGGVNEIQWTFLYYLIFSLLLSSHPHRSSASWGQHHQPHHLQWLICPRLPQPPPPHHASFLFIIHHTVSLLLPISSLVFPLADASLPLSASPSTASSLSSPWWTSRSCCSLLHLTWWGTSVIQCRFFLKSQSLGNLVIKMPESSRIEEVH